MSTIALCVPAYNAAWCLPRLLKSAKNQIMPFDEILIYNDCSTDNTEEIAIKYGAKVINGLDNKGCSYGKNKLAEVAKSEWLHFHDADDELLPNFVEIAKKWISIEKNLDIVLLNFEYRDFETNKTLSFGNYNREALLSDNTKFVVEHKLVNFALIRKQPFLQIGGFNTDPKMLYTEDRAFYSRAVVNKLMFDYEDNITCINYRYQKSMSASNLLKCSYANYHVSLYLLENLDTRLNKELAQNFWENATIAASFQDWYLTKNCIKNALMLDRNYHDQSILFQFIINLNPFFAFWIREKLIRLFKPHLRKDG